MVASRTNSSDNIWQTPSLHHADVSSRNCPGCTDKKNMIELSRLTLNSNKLAIQASIQVCHMLLYSEVHILGWRAAQARMMTRSQRLLHMTPTWDSLELLFLDHSEGGRAPRKPDHHQLRRCQQSVASTESRALTPAASPPLPTIPALAAVPSWSLVSLRMKNTTDMLKLIRGSAVQTLQWHLVPETKTVRLVLFLSFTNNLRLWMHPIKHE